MEDVLDLYEKQPQEGVVRLCMDERPCQLIDDVMTPIAMKPGSVKKQDSEYKRMGTCCIFLAYDIDTGQRYMQVRQRRKKEDYALFMEEVISTHYPDAKQIELVQDNLNTHNNSSFYEHLEIEKAQHLRRIINIHYTPKHGSWLNMAEIEFSALSRQCLNRRIASVEKIKSEVKVWQKERNEKNVKIHWSFTVNNAMEKMNRFYTEIKANN